MKLKFSLLILVSAVILGLAFGIFHPLQNLDKLKVLSSNNSREEREATLKLKANYFAEKEFYEGIMDAENRVSEFSGNKIYGGVVPHHLLPGYILSDFFEKLSTENPKRIILIGPNHNELGGTKPITSLADWETQFGTIESDQAVIKDLIEKDSANENNEVAVQEHAIGGILHYIKYYLPQSKVVPIILSSSTTTEDITKLTGLLNEYFDEETVIIASVDFSHYLNGEEAKEKDVVTKKVIEDFDYDRLYKLNNDYIDSPKSIGLLLDLMEVKGAKKPEILFNTNSGELLNDNSIQTTSYFSIFFTKK